MDDKKFDHLSQYAIPGLTIAAQILFSFKNPQWGLVVSLLAQPFWLYSTWKAYKKANQAGMLISTIILTIIITFGVINYWLL